MIRAPHIPLHDSGACSAGRTGIGRLRRWRVAAWLVTLMGGLLLLLWPLGAAEKSTYEENEVKGAFMAKFALFVDWPASAFADAKAPVTIGIIGDDPFGPQFDVALGKELANGRPFRVKRFTIPSEINDCQILFVSNSVGGSLPEILKVVAKRPILVVGDQERFAHRGGMVNFVKEGARLRFEVNLEAVEASGLKISAKLLQVARPVKTEPTKGGAK